MIKIVVDSCCELNFDMMEGVEVSLNPYKLSIGINDFIDDEN